MVVAAVELAGDVARDADTRGSSAGVGHGTGHLRSGLLDGGSSRCIAARVADVAKAEILNKAGEGHDGGCTSFRRWSEAAVPLRELGVYEWTRLRWQQTNLAFVPVAFVLLAKANFGRKTIELTDK